MKKVLIYSPNPLDGVSFYRQWGPLSQLPRERVQCSAFPNRAEELTHWTWFFNYDIAQVNRPHRPIDVIFVEHCKKFGLPVWLDYDDDLFAITPDNPVFETFSNKQAKECIEKVIKLADVISTSSLKLKTMLEKMNPKAKVWHIPNGIDDRLIQYRKDFGKMKRVAWRGSQSHLLDLFEFSQGITSGLKKMREGEMLFFGINPYMIEKPNGFEFHYHPTVNLIDFIGAMTDWNAAIHIVPLKATAFNEAKSHLAWLDATLAGSACLCPNNQEWDSPGMLYYKYGDRQDFDFKFRQMAGLSEKELKEKWEESWGSIEDHFMLSHLNLMRLSIIEENGRK